MVESIRLTPIADTPETIAQITARAAYSHAIYGYVIKMVPEKLPGRLITETHLYVDSVTVGGFFYLFVIYIHILYIAGVSSRVAVVHLV